MNKLYIKPRLYSFPNMGDMPGSLLIHLSDDEFAKYIHTSKDVEYSKVYIANNDMIMRIIDDEAVLIPISGDIQINGLISLNPIAQFLWGQFQTPSTIPAVIEKAKEKYDDEFHCIENDIRCFVNDYVNINFIKEVE